MVISAVKLDFLIKCQRPQSGEGPSLSLVGEILEL